MIKALFFDLDDTLFDATHQLGTRASKAAVHAMIKKGLPAPFRQVMAKHQELVASLYVVPLVHRQLCVVFGVPRRHDLWHAGDHAYYHIKLNRLHPYPGLRKVLSKLAQQYTLILITIGKKSRQREKINLLRLKPYFRKIYIVRPQLSASKRRTFQEALKHFHLHPHEVVSVGNRLDGELKVSKKLGMITVQMLQGKYKTQKPMDQWERPDYRLRSIARLPGVIRRCQHSK